MNDIDFDELDRAVNSLSGKDAANSDNTQPTTQADSTSNSQTESDPSLANRRSNGRFMDIMHPSSDSGRSVTVPERDSVATKPSSDDSDTAKASDDNNESANSPFIADAQVEKRPLGAFSNSSDVPDKQPDSPAPVENPMADQSSTNSNGGELKTTDDMELMPEELHKDVLAVESKAVVGASNYPSDPVMPEVTKTNSADDSSSTSAPTPDNSTLNPFSGAMKTDSIPQQYPDKPSDQKPSTDSDTKQKTIYDSENHDGLVKPKKKSVVTTVLWIAGLVIVGVGAGLAVYMFVLPNLR